MRVRGGEFYRDPEAALSSLWTEIEARGIEVATDQFDADTDVDGYVPDVDWDGSGTGVGSVGEESPAKEAADHETRSEPETRDAVVTEEEEPAKVDESLLFDEEEPLSPTAEKPAYEASPRSGRRSKRFLDSSDDRGFRLEEKRTADDRGPRPEASAADDTEDVEARTVEAKCKMCGKRLTLDEFEAFTKGHFCKAHRPARKVTPSKPPMATRDSKPSIDQSIETVASINAEAWFALSHWAKQNDVFQPRDRSLLYNMDRLIVSDHSNPTTNNHFKTSHITEAGLPLLRSGSDPFRSGGCAWQTFSQWRSSTQSSFWLNWGGLSGRSPRS